MIWETHKGEEEEDDVHDGKGEARLEHGAVLARVICQIVAGLLADVAKGSQVEPDAVIGGEVAAGDVCDAAQLVNSCYEGADEEEVHEGDEGAAGAGTEVQDEGSCCPGEGEGCDNEEDKDEDGGELVACGGEGDRLVIARFWRR